MLSYLRSFPSFLRAATTAARREGRSRMLPAYLKLTVAVAPQSRSNPSPGEEGDGREDGVRKENDIEDITLFIYSGRAMDSIPMPPLRSCSAATPRQAT